MSYNYQWNQHNDGLIMALNEQRKTSSHFCDITLFSRTINGIEKQIVAHKCVMAVSSGHLDTVINLPDNQHHNIEYDLSGKADADSIEALVEFAYTGKLVFTMDNFERFSKAIYELNIKNIEQESIDKIREDIEISKYKKAQKMMATQQNVPTQMVQVITTSPPIRKPLDSSPVSNKRRIVPKGYPNDNNLHLITVLPDLPVIHQYDSVDENYVKVNQEDSLRLLEILEISQDEVATISRNQLESRIDKCGLNAHQKSQVWEIRRKSKNRLAAAKCRKRKLEDIKQNDETIEELRIKYNDKIDDNKKLRVELQERLEILNKNLSRYENDSVTKKLIQKSINTINEVLRSEHIEFVTYNEAGYEEVELVEEQPIIVPQISRNTKPVNSYNIQIHNDL